MIYVNPLRSQRATPTLWFDYVDSRLQAGIQARTLNRELTDLQSFLRFVQPLDRPICGQMLAIEPLHTGHSLPRDRSLPDLEQLLAEIEPETRAISNPCDH